MTLRRRAAWLGIALASLATARAAVREVAVVPASVGGAPASAGASVSAPVLSPLAAAPGLLPTPAVPVAAIPSVEARKPGALDELGLALAARGAIEAAEIVRRLQFTDSLTGLPNRAALEETGPELLGRCLDPAVAMLDMNNFGAVNAGLAGLLGVTGGRSRADAVLALAGGVLGELAREHGVAVFRLGGEEFGALGPRENVLSFVAAARRALPPERLLEAAGLARGGPERRAVDEAMTRLGRGGQPVGDFTYGVAHAEGRGVAEALGAADDALIAAKDAGRRGGIFVAGAAGWKEWVPPQGEEQPPRPLSAPVPADTAGGVARLEEILTPGEKELFRKTAFMDPLTLARGYDYVAVRAAEWDELYKSGGAVAVLVSARNLKQINDVLGHEAGDAYLAALGRIIRREVGRARRAGLDVQEPVRVASKEFLLAGRDATGVARRIAREVERRFYGGMLTKAQVARLREQSVAKGMVSAGREGFIGTLRVVSEPLTLDGRTDVKAALDRAFERLEEWKNSEAVASPR